MNGGISLSYVCVVLSLVGFSVCFFHQVKDDASIYRLVYYGGCAHEVRKEVLMLYDLLSLLISVDIPPSLSLSLSIYIYIYIYIYIKYTVI